MGFGTLFFGWFLLLNITYYAFTDLIAALIMAMAFNKLSSVNKPFKGAFFTSIIFAGIGAFELVVQIIAMFKPSGGYEALLSYTDIFRYALVATLTLFMLLGIENVAEEVGLQTLAKKARYTMPFISAVYLILAVLSIQDLQRIVDVPVLALFSIISLLASLILNVVNLTTIYGAYMKICMPDDKDNDISDKPSKFGFVNKYREHSAEKQKEYIEYKLEKMKKKSSGKKKK